MHFHSNLTPWHHDLMTHHVSPYYTNNNGQNIDKCEFVYLCVWNAVILAFAHSNMVNRGAPLFSSSFCSGYEKMQRTNWKLIFPPFKTHMHFHLSGFMVVDLPGSGNECLPADENEPLAHEVEALQQEGKTWRGGRASVRAISFISL